MSAAWRAWLWAGLCGCAAARSSGDESPSCASGATVDGVDVSSYQGAVDWDAVWASGKRFAWARVAHGLVSDRTFARNWSELRRVGFVRGAYLYVEPAQSPEAQAALVVSAVGRLREGELPVALDVEDAAPGVTRDRWMRVLEVLRAQITAGTGREPAVYTRRNYWSRRVGDASWGTRPLWVAQYTLARCPTSVPPWTRWDFWQHSPHGVVRGVRGAVDLDTFNGSLDELRARTGADLDAGL